HQGLKNVPGGHLPGTFQRDRKGRTGPHNEPGVIVTRTRPWPHVMKETERKLRRIKMARQDQANDQFSLTSFLYGGNADYIETLYASWQENPTSVDAEWQEFFGALKDDAGDVHKNAQGASWESPTWPLNASGELVSALDGDWGKVEKHLDKK